MATYAYRPSPFRPAAEITTIEVLNQGVDSFERDLTQIYAGIDSDRVESLAQMKEIQLAAQLLLNAEGQRIKQFDPSDFRVAALANGANLALVRAQFFDDALVAVGAAPAPAAATEAIVRGRITDENNAVAGPVTVTLTDDKGKPVPGVAPTVADASGYYAVTVPASIANKVGADTKLHLVLSHEGANVTPTIDPILVAPGSMQLNDVQLNAASMNALNLGRVRRPGGAPRKVKPKAKAKGTAKRKKAGK